MPAFLALVSTSAPDAGSRLTIMRTLTPSLIIESAMVANLFLSPRAFWMSALTPAAVNACCRYGLSNDSQRADDCVSGRITPTWAPPPPAALLELPPAPPVLVDDDPLPELPQAARPSSPAALTATTPTKRFRMLRSFLGVRLDPRDHAPAVAGPAHPARGAVPRDRDMLCPETYGSRGERKSPSR